jgi:hypothetical protein
LRLERLMTSLPADPVKRRAHEQVTSLRISISDTK